MKQQTFSRVAIINRGEAAVRFIIAVREFNAERGTAIRTIALYTEPDSRSRFVREADESYELGPATYIDDSGRRRRTYMDCDRIERALRDTRAQAAWVGWGFVAHHAEYADLCERMGLVYIGPDGDTIRRLRDRGAAKQLAREAEVSVLPWSEGTVETLADVARHADRIGYPLIIKAAAGRGSPGVRRVHAESELAGAFKSARAEARAAFGDGSLYVERLLPGARQIEVQVVGDGQGTVWALGVRDCSVQLHNRKTLEESPCPVLNSKQDRELRQLAVKVAETAGFAAVGTVEFLLDPRDKSLSFMEINPRLQAGHAVTEMISGIDLVKLQIHLARGGKLEGKPPQPSGHAVGVRLHAEDPEAGHAAAPGVIDLFRMPTGPGLRVDTGLDEGDAIQPALDLELARVVAYGRTRAEALSRIERALHDGAVVIRGGSSNKGFAIDVLQRPELRENRVDVGWLDRLAAEGQPGSRRHAEVALVMAAIEAYGAELAAEKAQFFATAARGRPEVGDEIGRTIDLSLRGNDYSFRVRRLGMHAYRVDVDGQSLDVTVETLGPIERRLAIGEGRHRVVSVVHGATHLVEIDGVPHHVARDRGGVVRAPAPAVVVSVAVKEGDVVAAGDRLALLEAMKTETALTATFPGRVRQVMVVNNVQVMPGSPLMLIEPLDDVLDAHVAPRARFDHLSSASSTGSPGSGLPEDLRCLMLGFDVDPGGLKRAVADHGVLCEDLAPDDPALLGLEDDVIAAFVDIASLFRRHRPDMEDDYGARLSAKEYMATYLHDLGARGENLPARFTQRLQGALGHYGVQSLEPTDDLEESLFRIHKSHQRVEDQLTPILSVLQRRLDQIEVLAPIVDGSFMKLLDRLIAETQTRFPAVNDVAREVRYRYFDLPVLEEAQRKVSQRAEELLQQLVEAPQAADRDDRIRELVECPQSATTLLTALEGKNGSVLGNIVSEVLARRYYRICELQDLRTRETGRGGLTRARYTYQGKRIHLFAMYLGQDDLLAAANEAQSLVVDVPPDEEVVFDFFAWQPDICKDDDELQADLQQMLQKIGFGRPIRRVVVTLSCRDEGGGRTPTRHFTFRDREGRFQEERLYRGLHPMMARRLHLWRLANFEIERLPSADDVYLFRGVGRENPKDERLFALAEVRDVTPLRDASGRVVRLPHVERVLMEALAAIRRVQARRTARTRLHWNRVQLFAWPQFEMRSDGLNELMHRLAPATEGLGLEAVVVRARMRDATSGEVKDTVLYFSNPEGQGVSLQLRDPSDLPMKPMSEYEQKVVALRQRGLIYPYELISLLTPAREGVHTGFPPGEFTEYDLDEQGSLVPVDRPYGQNRANIVVGLIRNFTAKHPEGMSRVILLGDPSRGMGSLAEAECRRIIAALDLAEEKKIPLEWIALSAGAKISMDSGVENMDWISLVLRKLIEYTQRGCEVNVVVIGINVGAQPYWNAEATMLMHTRGILIMTADGAMVLTGKRALDYSGGVSDIDNFGIGGYERIMGPNGQAQYFARDVNEALKILLRYYEHSYVAPGERFPRRATTSDPLDRDVRNSPHGHSNGVAFSTVGDVFSDEKNPGRKKPFDIRSVMAAVVDQDHDPLERWYRMHHAQTAVVWDASVGGFPVCMLGLESRPIPRLGFVPADGPRTWTAGTLFPQSSKKVARAVNSASGNRPLVILANLSGFDGSPESMRNVQLEYGAEIGRAVVNFDGPIVFAVVSRYHGGAFVVFSNKLNENMEVASLEGTYASVIGGAPAAAVVFSREVSKRTQADPRVRELEEQIVVSEGAEKVRLRARLAELSKNVHSEKLGQVAEEFDNVHSVYRAQKMGSVHHIIPPETLRPWVISAVERGMKRVLAGETFLKPPW